MVGIPVYAAEAGRHDYIVQAAGAFDDTIRGILNLAALGQCVEIRIVVQRIRSRFSPNWLSSSPGICLSSIRSP